MQGAIFFFLLFDHLNREEEAGMYDHAEKADLIYSILLFSSMCYRKTKTSAVKS